MVLIVLFIYCYFAHVIGRTDIDQPLEPKSFPNYVAYIKALLLNSRDLIEFAENYPCTDLDPIKEYALDLGNDSAIRVCDLCPTFPFMVKLANTALNVTAYQTMPRLSIYECFGNCYDDSNCVAFTSDSTTGTCSLMDNNDGPFTTIEGVTTGLTQQPFWFINQWFYQRHTALDGNSFDFKPDINNLYGCIEGCHEVRECVAANYNFQLRNCSYFNQSAIEGARLQYGVAMIMHADIFHSTTEGNVWRFVDEMSTNQEQAELQQQFEELIKAANAATTMDNCHKHNASGFRSSFNTACRTVPLAGCDPISGCHTCYFPEIVSSKLPSTFGLPICKDSIQGSAYQNKLKQKQQQLEGCLADCLENEFCAAVDIHPDGFTCNSVTLQNWYEVDVGHKRLSLAFPPKNWTTEFQLIPQAHVQQTDWQTDQMSLFECLALCQSETSCTKLSFDVLQLTCYLSKWAGEVVANSTKNWITFSKAPSLQSPLINWEQIHGYTYYLEGPEQDQRVITLRCNNKECERGLRKCAEFCDDCFVMSMTVSADEDSVECRGIVNPDSIEDLDLGLNSLSSIYFRKLFSGPPTIESLNKASLSSGDNFISQCLDSSDINAQTLTTLTSVAKTSARRLKRFSLGDIVGGIESAGEFVAEVGIDIVTEVKDTVVGGGNAINKLARGDPVGALKELREIPIVKTGEESVKSVGRITRSTVQGDWEAMKSNLGDLAWNAVEFVPVGKVAGKAGKKLLKKIKTKLKDARKKLKRRIGRRKPKSNRRRKGKKKKKDNDDDDWCPVRRTRRSGGRAKGKRKCKRCRSLTITNAVTHCPVARKGATCKHVCEVGYVESTAVSKCKRVRRGSDDVRWRPTPKCKQDTCSHQPVIGYSLLLLKARLPSLPPFPSKIATVLTVLFDRSRGLPLWSRQYIVPGLQSLPRTGRKSGFRKHPCSTSQLGRQATNDYYANSGWTKGHLSPSNINQFSEKASNLSNLFVNIAPQQAYSNKHPWARLEMKISCFLNSRPGIVVTGVCRDSLPGQFISHVTSRLEVPKCFWKLLCYREGTSAVVVGFYHDNDDISSDADKLVRDDQVNMPHDQTFIRRQAGISSATFNKLWTRRANPVTKALGTMCMGQSSLSSAERNGWTEGLKYKKRKRNSTGGGRSTRLKVGSGRRKRQAAVIRGCSNTQMKEFFIMMGFPSSADINDPDTFRDTARGGGGEVMTSAKNAACNKRVIGYFTSWGDEKLTFTQATMLTHLVYAFMEMDSEGFIRVGSADRANAKNPNAEAEKSKQRLEQVLEVVNSFKNLRVMFAVGGWANSQYFSRVASNPNLRLNFIASAIELVDTHGFDGIDIDWEYPVTGGAVEGVPADKMNYVLLMQELRTTLNEHQKATERDEPFLISFAGAAGQWTLDPGFELPALMMYADWVNVMTYDFFGAWESKWGAYTGPPSPLYFAMPPRFSGKTNVDFALKYYACRIKNAHQINMGIPFYGRYWENVGAAVDPSDQMWRLANQVNGKFAGGYVKWSDINDGWIENHGLNKFYHDNAQTPYAFNEHSGIFLGYEDHSSVAAKIDYAKDNNLGGFMVWAIDQDDEDSSMLELLAQADLCNTGDAADIKYKCSPITDKRWWTFDEDELKAGLCGRSAPIYKGYYPVCDPDDPGYSCCGRFGYCGAGPDFCDCSECKNYNEEPNRILDEPIRPTVAISWYTLDADDGKRGRCGRGIPLLHSKAPKCNPDDENSHCCSNGGFCGIGKAYCKCDGCVNFKEIPDYEFPEKTWWTWADGAEKAGRCGSEAPKLDTGSDPTCDPDSPDYHCCSSSGFCGSGADFCNCQGCIDYRN